jgi:glucan phosphoethanolaminetransferase (alkaline phosphatase superfamily)
MVKSENFIYFFTICGFFIGLIFSILNFDEPEQILFYTLEITLVFYLIIHVAVMNFFDFNRIGKTVFNKQDHENIGDYFIQELDAREKVMDTLLGSIEQMNQKYEKIMKGQTNSDESAHKQAA